MGRTSEKGVALILTMILLLVMSVMAVSLMFLSQTETWSSMNYRLIPQSRDAAEGGVNAAPNYLINTYVAPKTSGTDPLSNYTQQRRRCSIQAATWCCRRAAARPQFIRYPRSRRHSTLRVKAA